jgi:hypothetical protein
MSESSVFVLLAIDTNPDPAPNEIWAFPSQAAAERFLRSWSRDFLGGLTHDVNNLPADAELVAAFRNAGTRVHLYECDVDGRSSEELLLFERVADEQILERLDEQQQFADDGEPF